MYLLWTTNFSSHFSISILSFPYFLNYDILFPLNFFYRSLLHTQADFKPLHLTNTYKHR